MKKFFITLLLAIISIGSSMAFNVTSVDSLDWSCWAKNTQTNGVVEIKGMGYDMFKHGGYELEIFIFTENAQRGDTLSLIPGIVYFYTSMIEQEYPELIDSTETDTVGNTIVETTYFTISTEFLLENGSTPVNGDVNNYLLENHRLNIDLWEENYDKSVKKDKDTYILNPGEYWVLVTITGDDEDGNEFVVEQYFPFTVSNTQSIWNTSSLSTQWHKEIRNGAIRIVNDNNSAAYNMYGMKIQWQ